MAFINREDLKWWAGLVASCALALAGLSILPHPWDKVAIAIGAVGNAITMYNVSPPKGSSNGNS